jgi:DNA-binding MarR family transcriptional regulator
MAADRVSEPRWLAPHEQQVWRAYLDVSRLLNERLNRQLTEDSSMSLAEYEILVQLSEHPDRAMRMSELAVKAVNSRSRLTHTVARMEDRGLVKRTPCSDDGRGVLCTLTDEGFQTIVDAAPGHVEEVRGAMFDPLDVADVAALPAYLKRLSSRDRR